MLTDGSLTFDENGALLQTFDVRDGFALVVARRAGGRAAYIRACMHVTIALNAYANGRRARSWRWLARALLAWPPLVADARLWGGLGRAAIAEAVAGAAI